MSGPAFPQRAPVAPGRFRRLAPLGVIGLLFLSKLKWVFTLLQVSKLGTLLSMLVTVWVYATMWGLPFAAGFVLLIFVHEMGHAIAMRQQGIPAGAPVFIPFVGAVIAMKGMPRNAWVEAVVGIGGPLLGTAGAVFCLVVGFATGSLFWFALASTGFLLNLFNMIPVSPLDGGRIVGVVSRWLWVVGFVVGAAVWLVTWSPLLLLILLIGGYQLYRMRKNPNPEYYDVAGARRVAMGAAYFGLLVFMALGMWVADAPLGAMRASEVAALYGPVALIGLVELAGRRLSSA